MHATRRRSEGGFALLLSMMLLALMSALVMSSFDTVMRDQQVAGFQGRKKIALNSADAGSAQARASLNGATTPTIVATFLGDAATYPHGQPSFVPDPHVADPVEAVGAAAAQGMNLRISGGGPKYQFVFWRFNVEGRAAGGTTSRVETAVGVLTGS
jgi:hypothetical protein